MPVSIGRIRVSVIKTPAESTRQVEQPLSVYMYFAGLMVSLSGMYAVTYDMPDTNFALILRALVVCGYAVSYWIRRSKIDIRDYQAPLLVVFATVMYFVASTAPDMPSMATSNGLSRPYEIQIVIIWIAILQSFTLCTDSAILFACVPSMALLGIMSSGTPDTEVQYAFVVFLAASTFLMVHENHLRTRAVMARQGQKQEASGSGIVAGQIALVACCVIVTMLIATVVASPIEVVGHALIPTNPQNAYRSAQNKQSQNNTNINVDDGTSVALGTGPTTSSDAVLLSLRASDGIQYLRGETYDYYTGIRFEDLISTRETVLVPTVSSQDSPLDLRTTDGRKPTPTESRTANLYVIPPGLQDIASEATARGTPVKQTIKVLGGISTHLYGAPVYQTITTDYRMLRVAKSGSVTVPTSIVSGHEYTITSIEPDTNPSDLRRCSMNFPAALVEDQYHYLQVTNQFVPRNSRLQQFADSCTVGKTTLFDKVEALRNSIATRCSYNLQAPALPRDHDVVEGFLFDTKQGYCDMFAAALTVLCRYEGIPSRYVTGFVLGDRQPDDSYTIREKHKHAWAEVYFPGAGWVPFDAVVGSHDITPALSTTTTAAITPLRWLLSHGVAPPILALIAIVLLLYVFRTEVLNRIRRNALAQSRYESLPVFNMQIIQSYSQACTALARSGFARREHETPTEYLAFLRGQVSGSTGVSDILGQLTSLHERFAYGASVATANDAETAQQHLKQLLPTIVSLRRSAGHLPQT